MVSKKRLKGHGKKHATDGVSKSAKYGGIFLLIIMVLSIVGFALSSGGGYTSNDTPNNQDFSLREKAFQNSQTGESYWGAVINKERFIFQNGIDGYEEFTQIKELSKKIKSKNLIKIQIAKDYQNQDSIYLIEEKLLPALNIGYQRIATNETCDENTLVFTNNASESTTCLEFVAPQGEEANFADILTYHMIKDLQ